MSKEEQIRFSIENMDTNILKDSLAILLSKDVTPQNNNNYSQTEYKNFAQAILDLKKKYTFPELNAFTTEADLVYVQTGDRRILITDKDALKREAIEQHAELEKKSDVDTNSNSKNSIDDAFENIKPNDNRFSRLEF